MGMSISGNLPAIPYAGFAGHAAGSVGRLALTALVLASFSNLPKADALGHFWKSVNPHCYEKCKDFHEWKGLACFSTCVTYNHFARKNA